jgi:hypothetical protein
MNQGAVLGNRSQPIKWSTDFHLWQASAVSGFDLLRYDRYDPTLESCCSSELKLTTTANVNPSHIDINPLRALVRPYN